MKPTVPKRIIDSKLHRTNFYFIGVDPLFHFFTSPTSCQTTPFRFYSSSQSSSVAFSPLTPTPKSFSQLNSTVSHHRSLVPRRTLISTTSRSSELSAIPATAPPVDSVMLLTLLTSLLRMLNSLKLPVLELFPSFIPSQRRYFSRYHSQFTLTLTKIVC